MPKNDSGNPGKPKNGSAKSPIDHGLPVSESSWDKRLREAREMRKAVLAAREAGKPAPEADKVAPEGQEPEPVKAAPIETPNTGGEVVGIQVSGSNVRRALFVFAGAAGFGMGVTLGVGILIGLGVPSILASPSETDRAALVTEENVPVAAISTSEPEPVAVAELEAPVPSMSYEAPLPAALVALPIVEAPVGPPVAEPVALPAEESVEPQPAVMEIEKSTAPEAPVVVGSIVAPALFEASKISLPEITAVRYTSADVEAATAAMLRTLPDVGQGSEGEKPYAPVALRSPKYYIHAPTGVSNKRLNGFVTQLDQSGLDVAQIGREGFYISTTHVRFYSADTEKAAKAVAADLGVEARDFSQNRVIPGRVEIWVAGRPAEAAVEEPPKKKPSIFERMRAKREQR